MMVSAISTIPSCTFFFQAEDGIRDKLVTGVQTCALPICSSPGTDFDGANVANCGAGDHNICVTNGELNIVVRAQNWRSEERRVGKERRNKYGACQLHNTKLYFCFPFFHACCSFYMHRCSK